MTSFSVTANASTDVLPADSNFADLSAAALAVLTTADPLTKVALTRRAAAGWFSGEIAELGRCVPPERPARPERPELKLPRDMPKRGRGGSLANRLALLHALAHIELNAIDLAWDIVIRFPDQNMPRAFIDDWVRVADDEARHFTLLEQRLNSLDARYGDLPAHDGLWQSATSTADDLAARLAIVPMVLEARGLDVTPETVRRLTNVGDHDSAAILQTIHDEEISHVAAGRRWFGYVCEIAGREPVSYWQELVKQYFRGGLKRPFNITSRQAAKFGPEFYEPIADPEPSSPPSRE